MPKLGVSEVFWNASACPAGSRAITSVCVTPTPADAQISQWRIDLLNQANFPYTGTYPKLSAPP